MGMILIALAVVAAAPLLPPDIVSDLRCVAVLAVNRNPSLAADGAFYAAVVGADAMDASGRSREAVRDLILDQVKRIRAVPPVATEIESCTRAMKARIAIERVTTK
jgi:hypothetical protein